MFWITFLSILRRSSGERERDTDIQIQTDAYRNTDKQTVRDRLRDRVRARQIPNYSFKTQFKDKKKAPPEVNRAGRPEMTSSQTIAASVVPGAEEDDGALEPTGSDGARRIDVVPLPSTTM